MRKPSKFIQPCVPRDLLLYKLKAVTMFYHTTLDVASFERTNVLCEKIVCAFRHVLREIECALK